ncbi:uncharacterized protein [Scyliorhinus torazame]|uniref:uncharacterized protein n=1 Tax=Scyliorhinus torazame TaxID=75743 RepID=UPI003B5A1F92
MLAGAGWLLLLSRAGFLLASMQPDCGGVLLPSVTGTILQYALPVTDSINGTRCSWTLHASSSETVELEIISYQTFSRTGTSCTAAYLAIKLGPSQRERRFCEAFRSIPEIGRKLVIRGKGPGVVTLRSPYGMKPGFTLRYSVLVPDANRRRIDSRTMELQTLTPLPSSVWGEGEQVHLSKGEAVTFSTSTGKGHQYILGDTNLFPVQERWVPPWTHQSSSSLGHSVPQAHPSDQRLRSRVQLQTGEIPATKDSQSHLSTTFGTKFLGTHTLPEISKTSQGPGILKIAALSSSNPSLQLNLASIFTYPSGSDPHPASLSGSGPSSPSPTTPIPSPSPTTPTSVPPPPPLLAPVRPPPPTPV